MKKGIHPELHEITVIMSDKTSYKTRSTWGKPGDVMTLDIDPLIHQAWSKDGSINFRKTGQVEKFTNKFAFLSPKIEKKEAVDADKKAEDNKNDAA